MRKNFGYNSPLVLAVALSISGLNAAPKVNSGAFHKHQVRIKSRFPSLPAMLASVDRIERLLGEMLG